LNYGAVGRTKIQKMW